jgi:plastocyanin
MTKTKDEFYSAAIAELSNYPTVAQLYQARDPRILASLKANAVMLSMLAAEQDVAAMEAFTKARDMTVLADAAVKGILPFGSAKRVSVQVANTSGSPLPVNVGRVMLDTQGRTYTVYVGATISASSTGTVSAVQRSAEEFEHTVSISQAFYTIAVPQPDPGKHIESVTLRDADDNEFTYNADFLNVDVGDRVFQLKTDENRQLYIQFGADGLVGYQPSAGEVFTVTVNHTEGAFDLAAGSLFAFEYSESLFEAGATLTLDEVLAPGSAPMDISTMREVASYPSVYDNSAVYLGNFDFLIRRNLSPFAFLSVWNEAREEDARGPSIDNINTIFVSALKDGVLQETLEEQIEAIILAADDSYKVAFVEAAEVEIPMTVTAYVGTIYDTAAVRSQMRQLILAQYGRTSAWAKRGQTRITKKAVYNLMRDNVQAMQDEVSDLELEIDDPPGDMLPEDFRYVSADSLTVNVEPVDG